VLEKKWKPQLHRKRKVCVVGLAQEISEVRGAYNFHENLENLYIFSNYFS
jgi:hypothetical protein